MNAKKKAIEEHLTAQYVVWEAKLYLFGRTHPRAELAVEYGEGTSGYDFKHDRIVIFIPDGNMDDFRGRLGNVLAIASHAILTVSEIELIHEMFHEYQFKEKPAPTNVGRDLYAKFRNYFPGQGHDEVFFTSIASSAPAFQLSPDALVRNL